MEVTRLRIFPSSPSHIGAYPNRDAVGAFRAMEYVKRGAFDCFTVVVCPNRTAFSCPHVGAYCIRSTNVPFMGRMVQMIDCRCAFLSPAGPFGGAYSIRPYPDGRRWGIQQTCIRPFGPFVGQYAPTRDNKKRKMNNEKIRYPAKLAGIPDALIFFSHPFLVSRQEKDVGVRGRRPLPRCDMCRTVKIWSFPSS